MYVTMQPYRECRQMKTFLPLKCLASGKTSIEQLRPSALRQTSALELLVFYGFHILLVYPCPLYYGMLILSCAHGACPTPPCPTSVTSNHFTWVVLGLGKPFDPPHGHWATFSNGFVWASAHLSPSPPTQLAYSSVLIVTWLVQDLLTDRQCFTTHSCKSSVGESECS